MKSRPFILGVALAAALAASLEATPSSQPAPLKPADAEAPALAERRTTHYDLYVEDIDADAVGELVETQYAALAKFFGRTPQGRLVVKVFSSHERYAAAIRALAPGEAPTEGVDLRRSLEGWGIYNIANRTIYVPAWAGPAATREAILHECVHQFHFLACCDNVPPKSAYYVEGLAEHFAVHRWDGRSVEPGTIPAIESSDHPGAALSDFRTRHPDGPRAIATENGALSLRPEDAAYAAAWGLVSFLYERRPDQFRRWAAALDAQVEPAAAWQRAFAGASDAALAKEYESWLLDHQEPWRPICGDWQNTDAHTFIGTTPLPKGKAFAVIKAPVSTLRASVKLDGEHPRGGVIIGYTSDHDYMTLFAMPSGYLRLDTMKDSKWVSGLPIYTMQVENPRSFSIAVSKTDTKIRVRIDGHPAVTTEVAADSRVGLAVGWGVGTFTAVEAQ